MYGESFLTIALRRLIPLLINEIMAWEKSQTTKKSLLSQDALDNLGVSKKSQKKKRKHEDSLQNEKPEKSRSTSEENLPTQKYDHSILFCALTNMESILQSISSRNWMIWREEVDRHLVTSLFNFHGNPEKFEDQRQKETILMFYRCLLASIQIPTSSMPNSLPHAIRLFTFGKQDPAFEIRLFCQRASNYCLNLIHPKIPSFVESGSQKNELSSSSSKKVKFQIDEEAFKSSFNIETSNDQEEKTEISFSAPSFSLSASPTNSFSSPAFNNPFSSSSTSSSPSSSTSFSLPPLPPPSSSSLLSASSLTSPLPSFLPSSSSTPYSLPPPNSSQSSSPSSSSSAHPLPPPVSTTNSSLTPNPSKSALFMSHQPNFSSKNEEEEEDLPIIVDDDPDEDDIIDD